MRLLATCLLILLLIGKNNVLSAASISDGYYVMPVHHEVRISGNFCELRTNHFHAGIDIRSSKGMSGDSIFSVAPGYLSRIRVQRSSYGQVLYIDHDNGTTSVYAHLDTFHPKIEKLLKRYQYATQSSEIDLYLDSTRVSIKQGDFIGTMGNTGRSTGPHLHFEIRDTKSEEPINPYLFGFARKDNIKPTLLSAWLHELDSLGRFKTRKKIPIKQLSDGNYKAVGVIKSSSTFNGIAIEAYDKANGWHNYTGVYETVLSSSSDTICSVSNRRFNFNENKSINSLIDYPLYKTVRKKAVKLYEQQLIRQSIYANCIAKGIISLNGYLAKPITVVLSDFNGNTRTLSLDLALHDEVDDQLKSVNSHGKSILTSQHIDIGMVDECLFEDEYISLKKQGSSYVIGDPTIPLNGYIPIKIKDGAGSDDILVLKGTRKSFGGHVKDGILYASINQFGTFEFSEDKVGPTIATLRFSEVRTQYKSWKFKVTDDFSDYVEHKSLTVSAYIDGQFIRSYFDAKSNSLEITDLSLIDSNADTLSIIAIDVHGNKTIRNYPL